MIEVTCRTSNGYLLLRPSDVLNSKIEGIVARAQRLYAVEIHAFQFLSNHYHLLLSVHDAKAATDFLRHVNRNVSHAVKRLTGWQGAVWAGRPRYAIILDGRRAIARLRYILSNGVKEGLVAHPVHWPGFSCASALVAGNDVVGKASAAEATVRLAPLPCWRDYPAARRRSLVRQLMDDIALEGYRRRNGRPPLGARAVMRADMFEPHAVDSTRVPAAYASDPAALRRFLCARADFVLAYRAAARRLAAGEVDVDFPPGSFPPRRPFVRWPTSAAPVPNAA